LSDTELEKRGARVPAPTTDGLLLVAGNWPPMVVPSFKQQ